MTKYTNKSFSVTAGGICFENCQCLFCRREREEKKKGVKNGKKKDKD